MMATEEFGSLPTKASTCLSHSAVGMSARPTLTSFTSVPGFKPAPTSNWRATTSWIEFGA